MACYNRKPSDLAYASGPKINRRRINKRRIKQSGPKRSKVVRIPQFGGLKTVRFIDKPGKVRLIEDRRDTVAKAIVAVAALLGSGGLVAYVGYDPRMDEAGQALGLAFLGLLFVLPAVLVFLIAIPVSRGIEVSTANGDIRFWVKYLGLPIRSARFPAHLCTWTYRTHTVRTRGQARQSAAGCFIGLLGAFGTLASGILLLVNREPDIENPGFNLILIVEGSERLHFVVYDQPSAHEFIYRVCDLNEVEGSALFNAIRNPKLGRRKTGQERN